jgi:hypothetical protein
MPHVLPSKFRFAHDYSVFLHDLIVGLYKAAHANGSFDVSIDISADEMADFEGLTGEELYSWVEQRKGREVARTMDYRSIVGGVTGDFCHFVLEALRASAKGKLTVAYALFRKPFRDNLFILEWLVADPGDFIRRFETQSPEGILFSNLDPSHRKRIIATAIDEAESFGSDPEFLYEIRYDRNVSYGLAIPWDQAVHLLTTWKQARTEPQNLNFIFSGPTQHESQWTAIYRSIPFLLYHASHVVDKLISGIAEVDRSYWRIKSLRRSIGFISWSYELRSSDRAATAVAEELLPPVRCPECKKSIRWHRTNLRSFALRGRVRCFPCRVEKVLDTTDQN